MKKPLLVFATILEAKSSLLKLQAKEVSPNFYHADFYDILITGMGVEKTIQALSRTPSYSSVINIGFCGALKEFNFGAIFEIHQIEKSQKAVFKPLCEGHFKQASLVTSDFPVHDLALKQLLSLKHDLVDMEGWGIASFCSEKNVPYQLIKIVSDFCSKTTSEEIRRQGSTLSEKLAEIL